MIATWVMLKLSEPLRVRCAYWRLGHVLNLSREEQLRLEAIVKDYYKRKK
jgi:hypothetical protein